MDFVDFIQSLRANHPYKKRAIFVPATHFQNVNSLLLSEFVKHQTRSRKAVVDIGVTAKESVAPSDSPKHLSACAVAIRPVAARLPMKGAAKPLPWIIVNLQLAGLDLGGIHEREFLPDFTVAVRDQNVGIAVCAY